MESLSLSTNDLMTHVVKIGMDVHPPIDIATERTRLNIFYEEAHSRHARLFEKLVASDREFVISKEFRAEGGGATAVVPTFVLTARGPVFVFPLRLPPPIGPTEFADTHLDLFREMRAVFFSSIPGRECLRIGLVRELVFQTGQTQSHGMIAAEQSTFSGAPLAGGTLLRLYRDDQHNHRIAIEAVEMTRETKLAIGRTMTEPAGYGLKVVLDVNNHALRTLEEADMDMVLDRATGLWPDVLLEFLAEGGASE